ncbi:MAG: HNH endonuclease signature motif containing protein [Sutterella parvirubra]|nr:HNH endonuclease signature motif containing protein [Sutterella parvirubra]
MPRSPNWTEDEITLALALYYVTPYSTISTRNPNIVALAGQLGRVPGAVSMKLSNLANCDPLVLASGRKGHANGSHLDKEVFERYHRADGLSALHDAAGRIAAEKGLLLGAWFEGEPTLVGKTPRTAATPKLPPEPKAVDGDVPAIPEIEETERVRMSTQRVGQNYFRAAVYAKMNGACAVTGSRIASLMDAAHVLPWSDFPEHRLDVANGLMLCKTLHAAFDAHLLGITPEGTVEISSRWLKHCGNDRELSYLESLRGSEVSLGTRFVTPPELLEQRYEMYRQANSL